jgi:hypothetical protein
MVRFHSRYGGRTRYPVYRGGQATSRLYPLAQQSMKSDRFMPTACLLPAQEETAVIGGVANVKGGGEVPET